MGKWSKGIFESFGYTVHKDGAIDDAPSAKKGVARRTPTLQQIEDKFAHLDTTEGDVRFEVYYTIDENGEILNLSSDRGSTHTHKVCVSIRTARPKLDGRDLPSYRQWSSDLYPQSLPGGGL